MSDGAGSQPFLRYATAKEVDTGGKEGGGAANDCKGSHDFDFLHCGDLSEGSEHLESHVSFTKVDRAHFFIWLPASQCQHRGMSSLPSNCLQPMS